MNIIEFSQRAGVSTATVSRAFHEPEKLRPDTLKAILTLAAELGYYPSPSGRALKTGRHDVLGAIWPLEVEGTEAEFAQRILGSLTRHLVANDLDLLLCPIDRKDPATLAHAQRTLQRSRCDAWILLYPRQDDVLAKALENAGKPVVCLMGELPQMPAWKCVRLNQEGWMGDALRRLKEAGGKSVALFGGREGEPDHEERRRVFSELAPRYFGRRFQVLVDWARGGLPKGSSIFTGLDSLIGIDDQAALMALNFCQQHGISVPEKMRVVGIDDTISARFSRPPLSSYRQPLDEMVACAVDLALGRRKRSQRFEAVFVSRDTLPEA